MEIETKVQLTYFPFSVLIIEPAEANGPSKKTRKAPSMQPKMMHCPAIPPGSDPLGHACVQPQRMRAIKTLALGSKPSSRSTKI